MTRTDNEQELVLGNKQLLSAFFVVVALLGVFFTAGYIVGRNTGATASKEASKDASANASPAPEPAPRVAPEPAEPAHTEPVAAAPPEPKPVRTSRPAEAATETASTDAAVVQSVPGHQYLQVMAVKRPEADKMVSLLRKRGLPALVGESSKPELFRVLVGPFSDTASLAKSKTTLKDLGFESVISK